MFASRPLLRRRCDSLQHLPSLSGWVGARDARGSTQGRVILKRGPHLPRVLRPVSLCLLRRRSRPNSGSHLRPILRCLLLVRGKLFPKLVTSACTTPAPSNALAPTLPRRRDPRIDNLITARSKLPRFTARSSVRQRVRARSMRSRSVPARREFRRARPAPPPYRLR